MSEIYTGVKVFEVKPDLIDKIYKEKQIDFFDNRYKWYENLFVVLKDETGGQQSALGRVKHGKIHLLPSKQELQTQGLIPKNKEQHMALDVLLDDDVKVVVMTGLAGSGKTLLTTACGLEKVEKKVYKKFIVSRSMSQVGKNSVGFLPGSIDEKFTNAYNYGIFNNLELLMGGKTRGVEDLLEFFNFEFIPLSLIRGASFNNCYIFIDEAQNLGNHEFLTVGSRVSQGSKIIICGDLKQIDEKIVEGRTGLYKFINSEIVKSSPIVANIHMLKSERGAVAELFANVFDAK